MIQDSIYRRMSSAEREVATLMKDLGIFWKYEHPIYILDDKNRPRVWTPDFFLTDLGIYLEVCGSKDFDYKYRRKIYEKNGKWVIFLHLYKESRKYFKISLKYYFNYMNYNLNNILDNIK